MVGVRRLSALLALILAATACSGRAHSSYVSQVCPRATPNGPPVSTLAKATCAKMASFSSIRLSEQLEYGKGRTCREWGAPSSTVLSNRENSKGWVDLNADGTIDAMRDGSRLFVSSQIVPNWGVKSPWVSVPADPRNSLVKGVILPVSVLNAVITTLTAPPSAGFAGTVRMLELPGGFGDPKREGTEVIDGHPTTHYQFRDPSNPPGDVHADVWIGSDEVVRRAQFTSHQDPSAPEESTTSLAAVNEPVALHLPPGADVTPLADAPVGPVIVSNAIYDTACAAQGRQATVAANRVCILAAVKGQDFATFTRRSDHTALGGGCQH